MTAETTLPAWLTIGAKVQAYGGRRPPGPVLTVGRVTKTLVVLNDGSRWRLKDLLPVGSPPEGSYVGYGPPRLMPQATVDMYQMLARSRDLRVAATQWEDGRGSGETAQAFRDAIMAIAPHLGLTVTSLGD